MPNRRSMLLGMGGLAVEIAVGLAMLPLVLPTAAAGSPPFDVATPGASGHFHYRNRLVMIWESGPLVMVAVDGRMVHINRSAARLYDSHMLPFQDFTDLRRLLRTLIDMAAEQLIIL